MKISVSLGLLFSTVVGYLYDSHFNHDYHDLHDLHDDYIFGDHGYGRFNRRYNWLFD